ncbi:periplasmic heavy metal sensor [Rhodovulum marinum]|uniref:Putative membrane protein n=1 Tax=Rhodovulum marinum TaxID=320662 RepID=A0A4R2PYT6_9RHOB|nr:periplasmic heavy metal sensor [Rhodovulum marinum]TCP41330.1 putative membrane protein [Rhodovulum marinum]
MAETETPTPGAPDPQPPRTRTWVRVALVTSLALNLLILGIVGGAVIGHGRDRGPQATIGPGDYGPYGRAFTEADRAALRAALKDQAPRLGQNRAAVRDGFRDLLAALRAEPYDHARVARVMETQQARVQDQAALMRGLMLDRIAAMPPEARAGFADRLERVLRRGPPRERDRGARP